MEEIKHIAIIPDGNRRWARRRGLQAFWGHKSGADSAEKVFEKAVQLKIPYFTFWGSSLDNISRRSPEEVSFLFAIFEEYFRKLLTDKKIKENNIRIRVIGRWRDMFPENLKRVIEELMEKTKNYSRHHLTLLMAYSGIDEMIVAVQRIAETEYQNSEFKKINKDLIKKNLWTNELPPVDLVIRTGGEPHWSAGFMMWDTADAKIHFSRTLWPDFTPEEFEEIISSVSKSERRFGK